MSFSQNPLVFSHIRGELIYERIREILREKIIDRKQGCKHKQTEDCAQDYVDAHPVDSVADVSRKPPAKE